MSEFKFKDAGYRAAAGEKAGAESRTKRAYVRRAGVKGPLRAPTYPCWAAAATPECTPRFTKERREALESRSVQGPETLEEVLARVYGSPVAGNVVALDAVPGRWSGGDYSPEDLIGLTQSLAEERAAVESGHSFIRIHPRSPWRSAKTPEELEACASHIIEKGAVKLDGSFRFTSDDHILVSRETLILANERGDAAVRDRYLPALRDLFRAVADAWGWTYPRTEETVQGVLESVRSTVVSRSTSEAGLCRGTVGSSFLKSRFKSYWHVDGGPCAAMSDDRRFEAVLAYRLGLNDSKPYSYKLSDGRTVTCHETFDVTPGTVRFGFIVQRNSVSWFRPTTAAHVYARYVGDLESPSVWDPSGGFGARMLGFAATFDRGSYACHEPAAQTSADLVALAREIDGVKPGLKFVVHQAGSETYTPAPESLDLVFTSPPYFDRERYFDEPGQCWRDYPKLESWTEGYLAPTFRAAFLGLKPGGLLVVNIDAANAQVVTDAALGAGFARVPEADSALPVSRDHFSRARDAGETAYAEPVLVFVKRGNT